MISVESVLSTNMPALEKRPYIRNHLLPLLRQLLHEREFKLFEKTYPHLEGFDFLEEGYAVKHVHLIERGGNYGDVYGWWQNDELGSFYLYTDGSVDDTKLNVKSPILFVAGDAIEYWKDAVGYTFVRSASCSIM